MKIFSTLRKKFPFLFLAMLLSITSFSQRNENSKIWENISEKEVSFTGTRYTIPVKYKIFNLNILELNNLLANAPNENINKSDLSNGLIFSLPTPDGKFVDFKIVSYNVMHPALAANYPSIKTYTGKGIDDPSAVIKLDYTPLGFHAMVLSSGGNFFIDPYCENNIVDYIAYYKNDLPRTRNFVCETSDEIISTVNNSLNVFAKSSGTQLRTYRLALACTGEYAATKGGTVAGALAGMATTMNRVNGVFETEVGIRMVMVANNNLICYTNASTDPYTNNNGSTMLGENISTCNNIIGSANYDIGHVFSTGGGGVAYLNGPCGSNKGGGVTGSPNPIGDAYDIDYVAHEMGHQFGGNHTFNSTIGSCSGGNRSAGAAYEPGSGVTIMAYAGICGTDNISAHSIAYFHTKSFDEITTYTQTGNGNSCPVKTNTGNTAPIVNTMGSDMSIPISTAFILSGSATDADNDPVSYAWEQFDLGTGGAWNVQSTTAPMFRSFEPTTTGSRTFPKLSDILNNSTTIGELTPNQARTLKFRLTARDGRGGVMHPDNTLNISVVNNGGAFKITSPNTAVVWEGGSIKNVTWNVSGTTQSPINTAFVKISLSTDGGNTFSTVLLESTINSGNADVNLPNIQTSQARIKVEAVGNIYFDICDKNFTINATNAMTVITTGAISPLTYCAGNNVAVPFTIDKNANGGSIFTAQLSNENGSFVSPVTIGTLSSVSQGTINATIPAQTPSGSGYRIRVISSNPIITGSNNGADITINNLPVASVISANGATTICQGGNVILSGNIPGGAWSNGGSTASSITVTSTGDYYITNTNSCGSVTSNHIQVIVNPLPNVSAGSYANVQTNSPSFALLGSPAGGTFTGTGVNNNVFYPATAGVGNFQTTYTYTNGNGCTNSAVTQITVDVVPVLSSITTGTISPLTYCSGNNLIVPFTIDKNANGGNVFTAQLSNSSGSFSNPVSIGTLSSVSQGSINAIIPSLTSSGTGYRIRVVSSYPSVIGSINSSSITVGNLPDASLVTASGATIICQGSNVVLSGNLSGGKWNVGGSTANSITVNTTGDYYVTNTNSCGSISSNHLQVTVNPLPIVSAGNYAAVQTNSASFALIGSPAGGTFSGTGVSNNIFYPVTAGVGNFQISYTFTNGNGCTNSSTTQITVNQGGCIFSVGEISGNSNACTFKNPQGGNATYTILASNAGTYTWAVPANSVLVSGQGTPTIVVDYLPSFVSGYLSVKITNACGGAYIKKAININSALPSTPGTISGPVNPCPYFGSTAATYKINKVINATFYNWVVPAGVNIISHPAGSGENDTILNVTFNSSFVSGSAIKVSSGSYCGLSSSRAIVIKTTSVGGPAQIFGQPDVCSAAGNSSYLRYYINPIPNAISYDWNVTGSATIVQHPGGLGTANDTVVFVSVNSNFTTGSISVSASNGCKTSASRILNLFIKAPFAPDQIFGNPNLLTGISEPPISNVCDAVITGSYLVYSINKVKVPTDETGYAIAYNWELSNNANSQIIHPNGSGPNDTIIRIYFGTDFISAVLSVKAERYCKISLAKTINLIKRPPPPPGVIAGQTEICKGDIQSYSVEGNSFHNYTWSVSRGINIISGQGTPSVTLEFSSVYAGGTVRVYSTSVCGNSPSVALLLKLCSAPFKPDFVNILSEEEKADLLIYPNPSKGNINLEFKNVTNMSKATIVVASLDGKIVYTSNSYLKGNKLELELKSKLLPGIYFIKTVLDSKVFTRKLIIQD